MEHILKIPATLVGMRTLKDGSIQFNFESQELGSNNGNAAFSLRNQFGWLIFVPNTNEVVIPDEPAPTFEDERTPSQRLRSVFFLRWKQLPEEIRPCDFNSYYRARMEALIDSEKEQLR